VVVDELAAVVESIPSSGNGMIFAMSSIAAITLLRALFCTDRFSVPLSVNLG